METQVQTSKNPLNDTWVFWYAPRGRHLVHCSTDKYLSYLHRLGDFNTVEGFFSFYAFLKKPSEVQNEHKLMLFRKDCNPLWEEWKKGGCWILQFMKKDHDHLMDKRWESLLIACIAEEIGVMAVIGVVLSLRSNKNQMEVWLSTTREDIKIKVGERLRVLLDLDPHHLTLFFKENAKSLEEGGGIIGAEGYNFVTTPVQKPAEFLVQNDMKELNID